MARSEFPNRLLATLPIRVRRRLISRSKEIELTAGEILCTPGVRLLHADFPLAGIVSTRIPFGPYSSLQVELAGREGMIGLPLVFGVSIATLHSHVQHTGRSIRLTAAALRQELASSATLRSTLGRYAYVMRAQLAETVGCNSFHLLEARLARWLLETLDRAESNEFHLTHKLLGRMLGVRRESVTSAASILQKRKLVRYSRGVLTILDREGLEAVSCRCYRSAQDIYERNFNT
jgi:CRP-like cAMP-binding protein